MAEQREVAGNELILWPFVVLAVGLVPFAGLVLALALSVTRFRDRPWYGVLLLACGALMTLASVGTLFLQE